MEHVTDCDGGDFLLSVDTYISDSSYIKRVTNSLGVKNGDELIEWLQSASDLKVMNLAKAMHRIEADDTLAGIEWSGFRVYLSEKKAFVFELFVNDTGVSVYSGMTGAVYGLRTAVKCVDNTGIEEQFDKGVSYIAESPEDESSEYLTVFDRFGISNDYMKERFA